jgi:hypothetical protein
LQIPSNTLIKGKKMSDIINLSVFTATYSDKASAENDYEAVKALYYDLDIMDTFDAAVIEKDEKDTVKVVNTHEQPTRQDAWAGAGLGLAAALVVALFPAVALTGALVLGSTATGAAVGAMVGHLSAGMNRGDLKELGEALDKGEYGLIVIAVTDVSARVNEAISSAKHIVKKDLKANKKELDKEIREALKS